ncbi:MAG: 2-hydroxyacid dehydrogenase [Clostridia bacterium]|nr:2-hydroxyacid dehydrogenase [Clostridia bacterium]
MKTILLTNHYPSQPYKIVSAEVPEGFRLLMLKENSQECLEQAAPEADYLLASGRVKITREVLDKAVNLKMVQRTGVGLDSLDLDALREKGIPLYVNAGVNAESVAEHTLLLMLACLRRLPEIHRNTANGIWKKQAQGVRTRELSRRTVGLIGMGSIARTLVGLLKGFGVTVLYYDPFRLSEDCESELGVTYTDMDTLLRESDIVSLHCPLTDGTRYLINADTLSEMQDGAILINTARGGLADTAAVAEALKSGKLAFAGLDVHEQEPLAADNPVLGLDNVILTPHIGGVTYDSFRAMMHDAMRNIALYDAGRLEEIAPYRKQ